MTTIKIILIVIAAISIIVYLFSIWVVLRVHRKFRPSFKIEKSGVIDKSNAFLMLFLMMLQYYYDIL